MNLRPQAPANCLEQSRGHPEESRLLTGYFFLVFSSPHLIDLVHLDLGSLPQSKSPNSVSVGTIDLVVEFHSFQEHPLLSADKLHLVSLVVCLIELTAVGQAEVHRHRCLTLAAVSQIVCPAPKIVVPQVRVCPFLRSRHPVKLPHIWKDTPVRFVGNWMRQRLLHRVPPSGHRSILLAPQFSALGGDCPSGAEEVDLPLCLKVCLLTPSTRLPDIRHQLIPPRHLNLQVDEWFIIPQPLCEGTGECGAHRGLRVVSKVSPRSEVASVSKVLFYLIVGASLLHPNQI